MFRTNARIVLEEKGVRDQGEARVNGSWFDYLDPDGYVEEWRTTHRQ